MMMNKKKIVMLFYLLMLALALMIVFSSCEDKPHPKDKPFIIISKSYYNNKCDYKYVDKNGIQGSFDELLEEAINIR